MEVLFQATTVSGEEVNQQVTLHDGTQESEIETAFIGWVAEQPTVESKSASWKKV